MPFHSSEVVKFYSISSQDYSSAKYPGVEKKKINESSICTVADILLMFVGLSFNHFSPSRTNSLHQNLDKIYQRI